MLPKPVHAQGTLLLHKEGEDLSEQGGAGKR